MKKLKRRIQSLELAIMIVLILLFLHYLNFISLSSVIENTQNEDKLVINVMRFKNNPIIKPEMLPGDEGKNINGPSLIRVPKWVINPLGKYYLYFAHHLGKYIRLAYADSLEGPWKIYASGALRIEDTIFFSRKKGSHIASPDVIVDDINKQIRMYFHGTCTDASDCVPYGQDSLYALSKDGISFDVSKELLGDIYFRIFKWRKEYYAFARLGILYKSRDKDGLKDYFRPRRSSIFPGLGKRAKIRHLAIKVDNDFLYVFYSCIGHRPERILVSVIKLTNDWISNWQPSNPIEVLRPEKEFEGAQLPINISESGSAPIPLHELRDPYIYSENGQDYLIYSVAGESGIAIAKLSLRWNKE